MKTTFVSGILCAALALQLPSVARAEESKPWFVRWVKSKAQRGVRLSDLYKLIDVAHSGNAESKSPVRDSQAVDVEFPKAPLDDLIGNGKPFGDKGAKLFFDRGRLRMKKGEYSRAIDAFDECLRLDPSSTSGLVMRGVSQAMLGKYDRAMRDFDRAIALQPNLAAGYCARGCCRLSQGDAAAAVEDFEQSARYDPQAEAYVNLGKARMMRGEYEQAIENFDRACELDPKNLAVLQCRAFSRFNHGEYPWAIEDFDRLLVLQPKPSADIYLNRALAWSALGQTAKAQADMTEAVKLNEQLLKLPGGPMRVLEKKQVRFIVSMKRMKWSVRLSLTQRIEKSGVLQAAQKQHSAKTETGSSDAASGALKIASVADKAFDADRFAPKLKMKLTEPPQQADSTTANRQKTSSDNLGPRVIAPWLAPEDQQRALTLAAQSWVLATSRYDSQRNGARAVELARQACEMTAWRVSGCLEVLAAAYAECSDFESADKYQMRAIELWPEKLTGRSAALERLERYRARKPLVADGN